MRSLLLVMLLATGCMGQIGSQTPGDDEPAGSAREAYDSVHTIMARCNGAGCHAIDATATSAIGKWVTADVNAEYSAINNSPTIVGAYSEVSPIITKIDSGHQAITYSAADRDAILDWLAAERLENQSDPNQPPPVDPAELLRTFSGCMTQENFDAAQVADLFGGGAQGNGQACRNCHQSGAFGFAIDTVSLNYFNVISTSMSQLIKYFGVMGGQVVLSYGAMDNAGSGSITQHPTFITQNLAGLTALEDFYMRTMQAQTAGGCQPPKAVNP